MPARCAILRIILINDIGANFIMDQNQTATQRERAAIHSSRRYLIVDRTLPICSESLFTQSDEVLIHHRGEHYRLRRTRNGKLILTK